MIFERHLLFKKTRHIRKQVKGKEVANVLSVKFSAVRITKYLSLRILDTKLIESQSNVNHLRRDVEKCQWKLWNRQKSHMSWIWRRNSRDTQSFYPVSGLMFSLTFFFSHMRIFYSLFFFPSSKMKKWSMTSQKSADIILNEILRKWYCDLLDLHFKSYLAKRLKIRKLWTRFFAYFHTSRTCSSVSRSAYA